MMTDPIDPELAKALAQLDGTTRSAVRLITGLTDEEIDELGGVSDD